VEVCDRGEGFLLDFLEKFCPYNKFLHILIQSFWVPCDLSSKNFSRKNLLFEAEIYVPGYAQNTGFCTIYSRASGGLGHKDHLASQVGLIGQPNNFLDNLF
jgi:hypothetical protein